MSDLEQLAALLKAHREIGVLSALNAETVKRVIVAGAYKGETMRFLLDMYPDMEVYGYEPQAWALSEAVELLQPYSSRAHLAGWALTAGDQTIYLADFGTDRCRILKPGEGYGHLATGKDAARVVREVLPDLIVLNVEGCEYELLKYLVEKYPIYPDLLVQHHGSDADNTDLYLVTLWSAGYDIVWEAGNWRYYAVRP